FYMRGVSTRLRLQALLLAVPALIGLTLGTVNGRSTPIMIGFGITIILLIAQRALNTPLSYRAAARAFDQGDTDQALTLINKSIAARPDFAESFQLRAMIRMVNRQFNAAEQDAKQAIALQPHSDQFYNTLGQILMSNGRYADMRDTYQQAITLNPDQAMHHYHLGLSQYRLGEFQDAAAAFSTATRKTIPTMAYDLLTYYYLWRSLTEIGETDLAQTTHDTMQNFAEGLSDLENQLAAFPELMHTNVLRNDIDNLKQQLREKDRPQTR
ncbi:MAG: tetratricopeptide repeat protein, partial [Anaerolineales bacterium]|nr:tetratricopeptide repeat protein [Anaerolineales bacterium]